MLTLGFLSRGLFTSVLSSLTYDIDIPTKCLISVIRLSLGEAGVMMVELSIRLCFNICKSDTIACFERNLVMIFSCFCGSKNQIFLTTHTPSIFSRTREVI